MFSKTTATRRPAPPATPERPPVADLSTVTAGAAAEPRAAANLATPERPRLLNTDQAADYLGVSVRTVKQLSTGRLPYVKIGRSTRLDPDDLEEFIARNRRRQRHSVRSVS